MKNDDVLIVKGFLNDAVSKPLFDSLLKNTVWHSDLLSDTGETVTIRRGMAYEEVNPTLSKPYKYANLSLPASFLSYETKMILAHIKSSFSYDFNSCLLNLYKDGRDEIRWHSDREEQLGENPIIGMISLGSNRTFHMMNKETKERQQYLLENGDLFIMLENCQANWLHAVLKEKQITTPRISLTFRKVL